ncbi:MAG: tRNA 4-thiouridine(8) synthase ThiI [Patescibacteria group bacterium]|nr:tRNA 4-thiouridine(8) synthase ThiI [Patescibacteria group bacterium]MDD5554608.1 tRNA 4-thiouridine(8) synthase ThiI [Patescibacteria group bacterium]
MKKKIKALVLLSGGLDSMLAAKILMEQGIEVTGISFASCFFGTAKAEKAAQQLGIEFKKIEFKKEHLEMVKNPASGYGKCLNPCIDCHALMIKRAGEYLTSQPPLLIRRGGVRGRGYDFIATGEVLGQRPMSQNGGALERVKKLAGIEVLRPLSALALPETEIEKKRLVNRKKLLDISGRTREKQMKLAEKYGFTYPSPAGGCLLTDPVFSQRAREMIKNWPECGPEDIELLKHGRIFWLGGKTLIVMGRNKEECQTLEKLAKKGDIIMELEEVIGPLTIVRIYKFTNLQIYKLRNFELQIPKKFNVRELKLDEIKNEEKILEMAGLLTGWYATKARGKTVKLNIKII